MGKKAKGSRKGKKAWRANISTEDIEDFFEKSTKDALSDLSVKRKIEKKREKVLHCDSLLQKNQFVIPVPSSTLKKSTKNRKEIPNAKEATQDDLKVNSSSASGPFDLWGDKDEDNSKVKKVSKPSLIPAVEVDPPGCSFNPSFESHQDTLACAVAEEMQKIYRNELGPEPVPLTVPGEAIPEEDMYFLDVDNGSDNDEANLENNDENEDAALDKRPTKTRRVTRVELNKRARRKEQFKKEAEAKKLEEFSKEIDSIPEIIQEIEKEDEEKQKKHLRRLVAKQERLKARPPRLGKYKFEPAPVQVLLTEEITGSMRKLKGCGTLVKDRYKSLEKRGLIVPTGKRRRVMESLQNHILQILYLSCHNAALDFGDGVATSSSFHKTDHPPLLPRQVQEAEASDASSSPSSFEGILISLHFHLDLGHLLPNLTLSFLQFFLPFFPFCSSLSHLTLNESTK
ncbi:ribosome biogenesis protein NOP53-like [Senna tora]|uniref:Ribosome biogenesis protein NOP53 n=1 Tax=Senna tora TaxID=362788 RepID=A0A834XJ70_9FABA|nr:ribosome biogenesis protein NOP53-like [Senna tora]